MSATHIHSLLANLVWQEIALLPLTRSTRTLEIGCREGYFAERLTPKVDYTGLEPSPELLEQARINAPKGKYIDANFPEWDPEESAYDLVLLIDNLHMFVDQAATIDEIISLMAPDGHLVLTMYNPHIFNRMSWWPPPAEGEVRNWLSRSELHTLLDRPGLERVKSFTAFPEGDTGFPRLLNASLINRPLEKVFPPSWISGTKEWFGFGQFRVVVLRRT